MPVIQVSGPTFTLTDQQRALVARARAAFLSESGYAVMMAEGAREVLAQRESSSRGWQTRKREQQAIEQERLERKRALGRAAQARYRESHLEQSRESWRRYAATEKGKAAKARADRAYKQRRKERLIAPSEAER